MTSKKKTIDEPSAEVGTEVEDVDLSDAPELIHPSKLRVAQRGRVNLLVKRLSEANVSGITEDLSLDNVSDDALERLYDVLGDIDKLLEQVAVDKDTYIEWVTAQDAERRVTALFGKYASLMGESHSSRS